jgi:hypothetical protein
MAGALLIVCAIEWAAGREEVAFVQPAPAAPVHPVVDAPRTEDTEEHDALGWTAFEEAQEPSDAMTIIGAVPGDEEESVPEAAPEPEPEPEDQPEPELPPAAEEDDEQPESHRRWWRRRAENEDEPPVEHAADAPRHVRVLPPDDADPWEQGFDAPVSAEAAEVSQDEDSEAAEDGGRRIFRRR